jgi:hypothetical protein
MKTTLSDWDAENLKMLQQRNIRRRECNGVKVQSLNRLVKKGLAIRFTGAFGEDEWVINAAAKPPGLVELEEILKVQATEAWPASNSRCTSTEKSSKEQASSRSFRASPKSA